MSFKNLVGVESEFLLIREGEPIVIPCYLPRDNFPILGEIRGEPGKNVGETVGNYWRKYYEVLDLFGKNDTMSVETVRRVRLREYKEAIKECQEPKGAQLEKVKNIYGTDISDYSDQIIEEGKIQGINVGCGLHIHFSSEIINKRTICKDEYERAVLPLKLGDIPLNLDLYRHKDCKREEEIVVRASQLNKPTIEWIVREMDSKVFERFAPKEKERTKYRQPGFYEIKPWGFEYRSLPANQEILTALPEIVGCAFDLLSKL